MMAGAAAALGSFLIDVPFYYSDLGLLPLGSMLVARLISGAVLAGVVGKVLADGLAKLGVLDNVAIRRSRTQ
jgi:energy-coupling factor transport system substrate-specific component